jgi:hypothetical protein
VELISAQNCQQLRQSFGAKEALMIQINLSDSKALGMNFLKPFLILTVMGACFSAFAHPVRGVVVQFKNSNALVKGASVVNKLALTTGLKLSETNNKYDFIRYSRPTDSKLKISELKALCETIE